MEDLSLPKRFLLEIGELHDSISHSRHLLNLIEESLNESISKITTSAMTEEEGDRKSCVDREGTSSRPL